MNKLNKFLETIPDGMVVGFNLFGSIIFLSYLYSIGWWLSLAYIITALSFYETGRRKRLQS
ncbi:MAG: hypothetical protein UW58_C0032G0005 [Candidatus Collierbacteria bacterium GW2011_GWC2_44_30]|nr:MAG: hypothetical protein UW58_C0032G0005 [Candidatus Collierbacteria bacterium GW2011_GWC2_44_30]